MSKNTRSVACPRGQNNNNTCEADNLLAYNCFSAYKRYDNITVVYLMINTTQSINNDDHWEIASRGWHMPTCSTNISSCYVQRIQCSKKQRTHWPDISSAASTYDKDVTYFFGRAEMETYDSQAQYIWLCYEAKQRMKGWIAL